MRDPGNDTSSLATLYSAERADLTSVLGAALTLVSATAAYLGLALFTVLQSSVPIPDLVLLALPLPAWALAAFHSLLLALSTVRSAVCEALEERLAQRAGLDPSSLGIRAGARVMDMSTASKPFKVAGALTYGGALATVVAFTVWVVWVVVNSSEGLVLPVAFSGGYAVVAGLVGWSYSCGVLVMKPNVVKDQKPL